MEWSEVQLPSSAAHGFCIWDAGRREAPIYPNSSLRGGVCDACEKKTKNTAAAEKKTGEGREEE